MNAPLNMRFRASMFWYEDKSLATSSDVIAALRVKTRVALKRVTKGKGYFICYRNTCNIRYPTWVLANQDIFPYTTCVMCAKYEKEYVFSFHGFLRYRAYFVEYIRFNVHGDDYIDVDAFLSEFSLHFLLTKQFFQNQHIQSYTLYEFPSHNTNDAVFYYNYDIQECVHRLFIEHKLLARIDAFCNRPSKRVRK